MKTRQSETTIIPFGSRRTRPCACVADTKRHIRQFLTQTLEELGFVSCDCAGIEEFGAVLDAQSPDLVVLGYGIEAMTMLNALIERAFQGEVLVLGPRESSMMAAVQEFGERHGVSMLPLLTTPYGSEALRRRVAALLPGKAPPSLPIDLGEALSEGWLELWYQPKIKAQTLQLCGIEALICVRHPRWGIALPELLVGETDDIQLRVLSEFVIGTAIKDWRGFIRQQSDVEIAINLPMSFLQDADALASLCRQMPDDPNFRGLIVEIDSAEVLRNLGGARVVASRLRFCKISVSIDDVGLEWPTLLGLGDFPFAEVKVDRQLICGCADSERMQDECRQILGHVVRVGARSVAPRA